MADDASLREQLRHVYWIGGGSGAGKSTVAAALADRYGLRLYGTDEAMPDHARRTTADDAPYLHEFMSMTMDERWLDRSPEVMFETFHWFRGEGFDLIVEDLLAMPREQGIVVEGFRLLPSLVAPLLADRSRAVWLLPSPEFRAYAVVKRAKATRKPGFLDQTSDPERAARNLAVRERYFVERLRNETRELELRALTVDAAVGEDTSIRCVSERFGLS
jgi:2-phosphoglycerate kinase